MQQCRAFHLLRIDCLGHTFCMVMRGVDAMRQQCIELINGDHHCGIIYKMNYVVIQLISARTCRCRRWS